MHRSVVRSLIAITTIFVTHATLAEGQIVRPRGVGPKPINWMGANIGIVQGYRLRDGATDATWDFGSSIEYAARFEHPTRSGMSVGLQATYSRPQLSYSTSTVCSLGCEANATVMQYMGLIHYGQGYTFHPVYELSVGAISFSKFQDQSNVSLGSKETDFDFRFAIGYGLGFGLSPTSSIEVIQEIGTILHQKTGLPASTGNYPRVLITRLGGKVSF